MSTDIFNSTAYVYAEEGATHAQKFMKQYGSLI